MSKAFPILALLFLGACASPRANRSAPQPEDAATLLERGDGYFDRRDLDNATRLYELAVLAASGVSDTARYVEAASQAAVVHFLSGNPDKAKEWLTVATARVDRAHGEAWVRWLIARGVGERHDKYIERALATFEEAYDAAREDGMGVRAVQAAYWAAVTATDERAVRWCRRAIEVAPSLGQERLTATLWSQLAWMLEERGLYDDAVVAFQRARSETRVDDGRGLLIADWSVGHALRLAGRPQEARPLMEDVSRRAERAYGLSRGPNAAEWVAHAQVELAELDALAGALRAAVSRMLLARDRFLEAGARRLAPERLQRHNARLGEMQAALEG